MRQSRKNSCRSCILLVGLHAILVLSASPQRRSGVLRHGVQDAGLCSLLLTALFHR